MMADNTPTKNKFGVPLSNEAGVTGSGILMPKLKYRFRVTMLSFGGASETKVLTQNVQNVARPKLSVEEVIIESYNSRSYLQGKHTWEQINLVVRDDITNQVAKSVGSQVQRQLNHFQQTTPAAGGDYKFDMSIEVLDGSTAEPTESWFLEGCFLTNVDYSDSDYGTNEAVTVSMQIRYDNATHYQGDNNLNGRIAEGQLFDPTATGGSTAVNV